MAQIDWSRIKSARAEALRSLKPLRKYPLIKSGDELVTRNICDGQSILDVGANDRRIGKLLEVAGKKVEYYSLDLDRLLPHDYYTFDAIDRRFDMVTLLDVIEHVSPAEVLDILENIHKILKPGGTLIITTPNVVHPNRLWRDCTHVTPFIYYEIAGFLVSAGFAVPDIRRIREMGILDKLLLILCLPVIHFLEIDHAYGIALMTKRL